MSINNKYKNVRTRMLVLSLLTIFSSYILFKFLLTDYFVQLKDLDTDRAVIQSVLKNKYPSYERLKGKVYKSCIDIILVDKPYFIRLSDHLTDNYWPLINDPKNIYRQIEVKFQSRFLYNNILHNPNQISIDNKVIIPYDYKKTFIGWFALAVIFIIMACLCFAYLSFRRYKTNLQENN